MQEESVQVDQLSTNVQESYACILPKRRVMLGLALHAKKS